MSWRQITRIVSYCLFAVNIVAVIVLGVWGFLLPPPGQIDISVIQFSGILSALATVAQIPHVIQTIGEAKSYKIQTKHVTIESTNN